MAMNRGGKGIGGSGRRRAIVLALLATLIAAIPAGAPAQMFSTTENPPPVPPASVPDPGAALNLAPSSGPAAAVPNLGAPPVAQSSPAQPPVAAIPPVSPPPGTPTAGQAVLSLSARYGKDMPLVTGGLVWRIFSDRPDESGTFKLIREDHS
ncbi:MAG TPA: hypothetical protein VMU69_05950, partial [Bradyrhizobium sp.]|nr:hypothetical protein [Bradyrhizobium sp.]